VLDRQLRRFRRFVEAVDCASSLRAVEEMDADGITGLDVESAVRTGEIVERPRDRRTAAWKFVMVGRNRSGAECGVVAKRTVADRLAIWRVFLLDE
jgi:hypothetical protein